MSLIGETQPQAAAGDLIKDGTDASFVADVIEASKETPVIVDFWATWCGPCRQLGPSIEKNVLAAKGKVKLVKIDIDSNPQFAGQLRVQSIPAVFAFVGGRPVDGFMGALPDSQVKQFVDRIAGQAPANATDELLAMAKESLEVGDIGGAAQAYAQVLQAEPDNVKAIGGLARCYLTGGDPERAAEIAAMAPADAKDADLDSVRAALALAEEGPSETGAFEQRLAKDPNDHEARYEIAKALAARGAWAEASDHLLTIIAADREWNDEAARKQLLTIFEAAGSGSDITRAGRRRLSSILFS
ncbi:putative thioredoxin [Phenylobacterium haematophilum]|uniref:Putative thioredoxin n=1 Tax=Phenylobacterium haematophilum TaxID=98513 RepID=A0A840A501_9CAUL|nr:co-chaperone YbbN [Phenylobacterium haematophilum]MBB3892763.1 putative thioredoxin [Phenylobacterium haematophilum]